MARGKLWQHPTVERQPQQSTAASSTRGIGCIGRFTPEDPVTRIAAPFFESRPSLIASLSVHEGDWVKAGQTVALLDGKRQLEAERLSAIAQLELEENHRSQVGAASKISERAAQVSEISRLQSSYDLALMEHQRNEKLLAFHAISVAQYEQSKNLVDTSFHALKSAQNRLTAMSEVRPEDENVGKAQIEVAKAHISELDARLAAMTVTSPVAGRVIKVFAHPGEKTDQDGILEIADTRRMAVEAEVYAADLKFVRVGQSASIEPEGEEDSKLTGVVISVGARVRKPAVLPNDPAAFSDAHVVPVHLRVSGCEERNCPIDGRVKVVIEAGR